MNTFNRVVLILLCVVLVVAAVAIIALTWTIPNRSINWLGEAVEWVDANDGDMEKAFLTTFSAFIGLVAMIVLLIELIPRRAPGVQVTGLVSGNATLSTAAIGQRIEEAVCQVPHVAEVRADVRAKKKGVLVNLDLQVDPEANLATVTDEACSTAEQVLSDRVHVALLRPPTARLHYRELRLQGRGNGTARRGSRTMTPVPPMEPPPESYTRTNGDAEPVVADTPAAVAVADAPPPPELPESLSHHGDDEVNATPVRPDEEKNT